jgi:hypothetical protein
MPLPSGFAYPRVFQVPHSPNLDDLSATTVSCTCRPSSGSPISPSPSPPTRHLRSRPTSDDLIASNPRPIPGMPRRPCLCRTDSVTSFEHQHGATAPPAMSHITAYRARPRAEPGVYVYKEEASTRRHSWMVGGRFAEVSLRMNMVDEEGRRKTRLDEGTRPPIAGPIAIAVPIAIPVPANNAVTGGASF